MKKIKILSTENHDYFTVGKVYEVIEERNMSDDGYEAEIVVVIDDEGDEFHIINGQEAIYELIKH